MLLSLCCLLCRRVLQLVTLCCCSNDFKALEIIVLRHELGILRRRTKRPPMTNGNRLFLAAASRLLRRVAWRSFHAGHAVAVASPLSGEAVDLCRTSGSPAGSTGDSGVGSSSCAREPPVGLPAHGW